MFLAIMALAAFTACSSDDEYQWATVSGEQVYFSNELPSNYNITAETSTIEIPIRRVAVDNAINVPIILTSDDDFFTGPSSVSFSAGQSEASITISYNPEELEYNEFRNVTLQIGNEEYTTPYGNSSYVFSCGMPLTWTSLGKGTYIDTWFGAETTVEILSCDQQKGVYHVSMPYKDYDGDDYFIMEGPADEYLELTVHKAGDVVGGVTLSQNDLVTFPIYSTGAIHPSYTDDVIVLVHPYSFSSLRAESNYLFNTVKAYKEDGSIGMIQLAPYFYMMNYGGWNYTQRDGVIEIYFPGYEPKDYSAEFAVTGVFTDLSNAVFAEGILELGADVQDVRGVVVEADADADAVADAIANGDIETTSLTAGHVYIPIPEGLSGKLQAVVAVFDEEGALQGTYSSNFEYYGGGANPWESIGIGLYTDDFFPSLYNVTPTTWEVEIEENTETPGLYRMVYPYGESFPYNDPGDWDTNSVYNIEINAEDPDGVYILLQNIGVDWGNGMYAIASLGGYYLGDGDSFEELKEEGYLGTLKDGIITLPVFDRQASDGSTVYYQGIFAVGSSAYYGCPNGAFKLVLPEAVSGEARAKARAQAKARSFEKRLYGKAYSMKSMRNQLNRMAPLQHDRLIAE